MLIGINLIHNNSVKKKTHKNIRQRYSFTCSITSTPFPQLWDSFIPVSLSSNLIFIHTNSTQLSLFTPTQHFFFQCQNKSNNKGIYTLPQTHFPTYRYLMILYSSR